MSRHRDLMRAYDAELTPEEAAELERSLSDEDRRVLAGLEQVGDVVRACEPEAVALWVTTPKAPAPSAPAPLAASFASPTAPVSPSAPTESLPEPPDEDADLAATIEAVDFGNQPGSIFMVPAGEESTPVVWLEDEPAGARMEPL